MLISDTESGLGKRIFSYTKTERETTGLVDKFKLGHGKIMQFGEIGFGGFDHFRNKSTHV